jgi:biopolymer transport protein ExbD/Zn-dependent protease with chaperone function
MSSLAEATRLGAALPGWVLGMSLATGALLAGALLADRLLERRVSAAVRLLLPAAVLARLALPAHWQSPLGLLGLRQPVLVTPGEPDLAVITLAPADQGPSSFGAGWLVVLYLAVVALLLGRWLHARVALRRRLGEATALDALEGVPVLRHPSLGPLVAGLWRPTIVVPDALAAAGEALQWVLRHELAHVRRRDLLVGSAVQLACIMAWPVLPAWIAARRARVLMELACDEHALRGADGAGRRRYGELLLALAAPRGRPLLPAVSFGSPLRGRLRALGARRRWPRVAQAAMVAALAALCFACAGEPELGDPVPVAPLDAQTDVAEVATPAAASTAPRPPTPAPAVASPPTRTAIADGRFPPTLWVQHDGVLWLHTRRGGSLRVGDAQPLERAIREALAETGSSTLLIERTWSTSEAEMARVREAARRAGAKHLAVSTPDRDSWPRRSGVPLNDPVITISSDGALHLHGERIAPEDLEARLRRELGRNGSQTVLLRGSQQALRLPGKSDEIFALARRAGARNVGILTEPLDHPPALSTDGGRGTLDKSIIRRAVQEHLGDVRDCYERYRDHEPGPSGRLVVKFTIDETGTVVASQLDDSTVGAPPIESCVVKAVRRWTFPRPEHGVVIVSYPFELTPSPAQFLMLPDQALKTAMASHTAEIQRDCARNLRVSLPGGRVVFRWTILPSGEVSHVEARRGMEDLEACVAGKLAGVRLPRPPAITGPLVVELPVVFAEEM